MHIDINSDSEILTKGATFIVHGKQSHRALEIAVFGLSAAWSVHSLDWLEQLSIAKFKQTFKKKNNMCFILISIHLSIHIALLGVAVVGSGCSTFRP